MDLLARQLGYLAKNTYERLAPNIKSTFGRLHGVIKVRTRSPLSVVGGHLFSVGRQSGTANH